MSERRGFALVSVSEIHAYPLRPEGFEEPLFPTAESNRKIVEHLLEAPWLKRASELEGHSGEAAHSLHEPVELRCPRGRRELVRPRGSRRCPWSKKRVVKVLDRWREVGEWWDEERHKDRLVFRVLLSCGSVADVARERSDGWFLVGMVD
jgi:hypothetical protein